MKGRPVARRNVVIIAAGRTGSTLLQSAFLAACNAITFFEPCRHSPLGDVRHVHCVDQVLNFINCRLPMKQDRWNPPSLRTWLQHPYRVANLTSCSAPPFYSVKRTRKRCRSSPFRVVKEIRLVGELALLASALRRDSSREAALPSAIIHLVRDPRALLASFKKLNWWEMQKGRLADFKRIARGVCSGMVADADAGAALNSTRGVLYLRVRFEDLVWSMREVVSNLYTNLGWPRPQSVDKLVQRVVRGDCKHRQIGEGNVTAMNDYDTCRNSTARKAVNRRWLRDLSLQEKRAAWQICGGALRRFRYATSACTLEHTNDDPLKRARCRDT